MPAPQLTTSTPSAHYDDGWWQANLEFTDWSRAGQTATEHLLPQLHRLHAHGALGRWWFMRKHPCWRLRLSPGQSLEQPVQHAPALVTALAAAAGEALDGLVTDGQLARWWPVIYEPETAAFGGPIGIETAHTWFAADSHAILTRPRRTATGLGHREVSMLLCTTMLRAAGLEWYEQGDVWHRVTNERPLPATTDLEAVTSMAADLRHLLLTDLTPTSPLFTPDGPLAGHHRWFTAAQAAGTALGAAARAGHLTRGLRHVLAYHTIFHWNRIGLPATAQAALARAARTAVLDLPVTAPPTAPPPSPPAGESDAGADAPPVPHHAARGGPSAARDTCGASTEQEVPERVLARFPLAARPRLRCPALPDRLRDITDRATTAHHPDSAEDRVERACSAWNLAALLAADCGMTGLAHDLCRQQDDLFRRHWPLRGPIAIAALQPVVNLIRLDARAGHPDRALHALTELDDAIRHGRTTHIAGLAIDGDRFTASITDRPAVGSWLRTVLCEDGTRFAAATGDRARAAAHAARYDDTPDRLLEARQTAIVHHTLAAHPDTARLLLDTSTRHDPDDHALAAVLRAALPPPTGGQTGPDRAAAAATQVRAAITSAPHPGTTHFHVRLGLATLDLLTASDTVNPSTARPLLTELAARAAHDALSARDLLRHPVARTQLSTSESAALVDLVQRAGLGHPDALTAHLTTLMTALEHAAATLHTTLTS